MHFCPWLSEEGQKFIYVPSLEHVKEKYVINNTRESGICPSIVITNGLLITYY